MNVCSVKERSALSDIQHSMLLEIKTIQQFVDMGDVNGPLSSSTRKSLFSTTS